MTEEALIQLASSTGPLGSLIIALAIWLRGAVREIDLRLDGHERRLIALEEQGRE